MYVPGSLSLYLTNKLQEYWLGGCALELSDHSIFIKNKFGKAIFLLLFDFFCYNFNAESDIYVSVPVIDNVASDNRVEHCAVTKSCSGASFYATFCGSRPTLQVGAQGIQPPPSPPAAPQEKKR